jgi:hypothetical protein
VAAGTPDGGHADHLATTAAGRRGRIITPSTADAPQEGRRETLIVPTTGGAPRRFIDQALDMGVVLRLPSLVSSLTQEDLIDEWMIAGHSTTFRADQVICF